ncbi:MAG: tRNA guanosine(34) transglycosylase Tgt [Calditrichota bacterium]
MNSLDTPQSSLQLPVFMPDATRAVVRTLDSSDLESCQVEALMVNLLHLSSRPGTSVIAAAGGIKAFMGWSRPVAVDSGGYQIFSLLAENPKRGSVGKEGFTYRLEGDTRSRTLTPEKCIQRQLKLGADILFCLDYCTHPEADHSRQIESVQLTVEWARRCRLEFYNRREQRQESDARPLLFAVVQGGADSQLRRECAERLLEMGFDGYGFGGWPIDSDGGLIEMVEYVSELIPPDKPLHGLGIGRPDNLVKAFRWGYSLFDCVIPTREGRRGKLFILDNPSDSILTSSQINKREFYHNIYIQDEIHARHRQPVDFECDCLLCRRYSCSYLAHLFHIEDPLGQRLATIHNLRFYTRLIGLLRKEIDSDG